MNSRNMKIILLLLMGGLAVGRIKQVKDAIKNAAKKVSGKKDSGEKKTAARQETEQKQEEQKEDVPKEMQGASKVIENQPGEEPKTNNRVVDAHGSTSPEVPTDPSKPTQI